MTHNPFTLSPGLAPASINEVVFGVDDDDVEMGASPLATDIFNGGGGGYLRMMIHPKVRFRLILRL